MRVIKKESNKTKVFSTGGEGPGHWTAETNRIKVYNNLSLLLQKFLIIFCKNVEVLLYI